MGCAAAMYQERLPGYKEMFFTTLLTCDYGKTTVHPFPYYETGMPGRGCKSGLHSIYTNLCKNEHYGSVEERIIARAQAEAAANGNANAKITVTIKTFHH